MGFMKNNNQAINFSIKIADKYFNFNNGVSLNVERHMGDTMNKFQMTIIDGSSKTSENIDMLFNNGGQKIDIKYGYGSNLVSMSGFIVDYKHTFVGDVYKLDMSGYVSLSTTKNIYAKGVNKYYIDWGPCIPKRINEGMQWDAFYTAVQSSSFWVNSYLSNSNTSSDEYRKYSSLKRFSKYYMQESATMQRSLEAEQRYYKLLEEALKNKNESEAAKMESWGEQALYNIGWALAGWWNGSPTASEYNKQMEQYSANFANYARQWQDMISQYSAANNIVALKIVGPAGYCYIPYPDLFILFDNSCPKDLDENQAMCDTWAFGIQTSWETDDKGIVTKFWINNDWCEMVKDEWKLRILTANDQKYIWVGDVPQKINKVTDRSSYQIDNKKNWLTAAYNAATPIRDSGIRVSDIVKNLCDLEGWDYDDTTIVETGYTNGADDALRMDGQGAFEYIVEKLCPIAADPFLSSTNYKAWFDSNDKFHFEPLTIGKPKDFIDMTFGYNIKDSPVLSFQITTNGKTIASYRNDAISGIDSSTGEGTQITSTARDFKSALVLAYEKDPDNKKLLFNESLYNTLGFNSSKGSYDYYKSEVMVNGEVKGNSINIVSQNKHMSSVSSPSTASTVLANDMAHFEEKLIQAEMTIIGDPRVKPGRWIRVTNMVKGGRRHYSSGGQQGYWIESVIDSVSSDGFTQKLKLIRFSEDSVYFQENNAIDRLYKGSGSTYKRATSQSVDQTTNSSTSGGGSTNPWKPATGSTTQDKTWNALKNAGYSDIAAAAVMGNIQAECSFNSNLIEKGNGGAGFGLCQWSYGRRTALENFARHRGVSASSVDLQLEFLIGELTPGGGADGYATYQMGGKSSSKYDGRSYTAADWKNATDLNIATTAFMAVFERPSYNINTNHLPARKQYSQGFYNKYAS